MKISFKFTPGLILYPVLLVGVYYGFSQPELSQYTPLRTSLMVLFAMLTISSFFGALNVPVLPYLLRGLALAGFVYTYPNTKPFNPFGVSFQIPLSMLIAGITITKSVKEVPRRVDLVVRGIGLFVVFYSVSALIGLIDELDWLSSLVFYLGFVPLIVYVASFVEALVGGEYVEKRIKGFVVGLVVLFLYMWGRKYIGTLIPKWAPFVDLGVFSILVVIALLLASNLSASKSVEAFLVGEWKKHEARIKIQEDESLKEAREIIDDFIVKKNKLPLLAYVSYYGSRVVTNRDELADLIRPLVEYSDTTYSSLTPGWLVKKYEKMDMERRIEIVEKLMRRLGEWS